LSKWSYDFSIDVGKGRGYCIEYLGSILLHKLNFNISDFVIDGEYLWLLSEKTSNGNYRLMKVKPL